MEYANLQKELKQFNVGTKKGYREWLVSKGAVKIVEDEMVVAVSRDNTKCLYADLMKLLDRASLNKKTELAGSFGTLHVNKPNPQAKNNTKQSDSAQKQSQVSAAKATHTEQGDSEASPL